MLVLCWQNRRMEMMAALYQTWKIVRDVDLYGSWLRNSLLIEAGIIFQHQPWIQNWTEFHAKFNLSSYSAVD